jgi:pimeloyl-ACP methyl ester carboxylesterase
MATMSEFAFAEVNGHRLRYLLSGEGPLTVFGHGILGSIEQVFAGEAALVRLERRLRLLFYDARGHGQSDGPAEAAGYTWATLGEDMAHFIETHSDGPAIVGGASMGAATALWVALERPELVRALVVLMPPPLGIDTMRAAEERQAIAMLEAVGVAIENFGLETTVENLALWPGFAANEDERASRAAWLTGQNPATVCHVLKGLVSAPFHDPEMYRRIEVPMLVLAHEGDGLHPARAARLLAENAPNARLLVAEANGYWQANPDALFREMEGFLDALG